MDAESRLIEIVRDDMGEGYKDPAEEMMEMWKKEIKKLKEEVKITEIYYQNFKGLSIDQKE